MPTAPEHPPARASAFVAARPSARRGGPASARSRVVVAASLASVVACACRAVADEAPASPGPPPAAARAAAAASDWEGALGLNAQRRGLTQGDARAKTSLTPVVFIRWRRFSLTNAGGFVTRRDDDVARGLGFDMLASDALRLNASLRLDPGRRESDHSGLAGMGSIRPTLRVRLNAAWRLGGGWRAGAAWTIDALGRGGGDVGDVSVAHAQRVGDATVLTLGGALSVASTRYMRSYHGVSPGQSLRSGYPVFDAHGGLRDASVSAGTRTELDARWTMLGGASVSRLLGDAAASPLTRRPYGWGLSLGAARRF